MQTRVTDLEQEKDRLQDEIISLHYLKRTLASIEERDRALRGYFGMERYRFLEQIIGTGGAPNRDLSMIDIDGPRTGGGQESHPLGSQRGLPARLKMLETNYEVLHQLFTMKDRAWKNTPNIIPVDLNEPRISSGFGWRRDPFTNKREFHVGIDIIGPKDAKIISPADGLVIKRGYDQWLGNYIVLLHTKEIKTIYGHLNKILADEGAIVKRGDILGLMGNSGLSTNNHLHYAVIKNDRAVNPMEYILDIGED